MIDLAAFEDFCAQITIPSKDEGLVKFDRLYGTQRYSLGEIKRAYDDGIHDIVELKCRQIGETTKNDAFRIWLPQVVAGTQGMFVSNSDENRDYRRDVCLEMLASLPRPYRLPIRVNNKNLLAWPNGSRLMFDAAGVRGDTDLGRSRGINFLDADEIGLWPSDHDVEALRASLSTRNPHRLYLWNGTARGFNIFWEMWRAAQKSTTQRAVFVTWWRHELYQVTPAQTAIWERYGGRVTADERAWTREVQRLYGVTITPEQLVWYRQQREETFYGNETMLAQEFPCLPDDAFQAHGDHFIGAHVIQRLRLDLKKAPKPKGYTWHPGAHLDESAMQPASPSSASLIVWEEPEREAAYIIAGHPWGSSSPNATQWVAQVYRAWPDHLVQVAEYTADEGTTYGFAWLLLYLAGAYNVTAPPFMIVEANGPGYAVMKQIQLLRDHGYGLSASARKAGMQDFLGCFQHYFYARPDNIAWRTAPIDWKTNPDILPYLMHSLADTVIRGHMTIRSAATVNALASLRRGESGDNDQIEGGGAQSDAHAKCAALAVKHWQDFAMMDLEARVPRKEIPKNQPTTVQEHLVATMIQRVMTTGRAR